MRIETIIKKATTKLASCNRRLTENRQCTSKFKIIILFYLLHFG